MKKLLNNWVHVFEWVLTDNSINPTLQRFFLGLILLACLIVRLWTIDSPAIDRTFWKEIDYIEISLNYWKHGFNFIHPELTWPAEPPRMTAMEFPSTSSS